MSASDWSIVGINASDWSLTQHGCSVDDGPAEVEVGVEAEQGRGGLQLGLELPVLAAGVGVQLRVQRQLQAGHQLVLGKQFVEVKINPN